MKWLVDSGRVKEEDEALMMKLCDWWIKWTKKYPQFIGSQRAGRLERLKKLSRKRNIQFVKIGAYRKYAGSMR